jgi:GTPase
MLNPTNQKAVLVGIQLPKVTNAEFESSLQELTRLVNTLGYQVVGQVTQKRDSDKSAVVLGEGKLKELARWTGGTGEIAAVFEKKKHKAALRFAEQEEIEEAEDTNLAPPEKADIVIVDTDLTPSQLRNLESASGTPVLDRTGVIIEIFSRHAKTKAARLQVEIARLNYVAPRLRESQTGGDRQGGGIGGKGSGETSHELDKRRIRDRIKELRTY